MVTGVVHWWITYSLVNSATIIDGGDHIASILSVLLIPITLTDMRTWHWSTYELKQPRNIFFPVRSVIALTGFVIIKIQIAVIYLNSAAAKLFVREWTDGSAIYYWFKHPIFGYPKWLNFLIEPLILNGTTLFIITWGTIIFEFILFAGLFMERRLKKWVLVFAIAFHLGIFIIHGLASFFFTMLAALIFYLVPIEINYSFSKLPLTLKRKFYDSFSSLRSGFAHNGTDH